MTKLRRGIERKFKGYNIIDAVQDHLDGTSEVVGYYVVGRGSDPTWVHPNLESATRKVEELTER